MIQLEHRKLRRRCRRLKLLIYCQPITHISPVKSWCLGDAGGEKCWMCTIQLLCKRRLTCLRRVKLSMARLLLPLEKVHPTFARLWRRGGICWLMRVTGYLRERYLPWNFRFEYSESSRTFGFNRLLYTDNKIITRGGLRHSLREIQKIWNIYL